MSGKKKSGLQGVPNPVASIKKPAHRPSSDHPLAKSVTRDQQARIVPLEQLRRNEGQPRRTFDPEAIAQLAADIEAHGLLNPITVVELEDGTYQIIAGERRYRALQHLEAQEAPVRVVSPDSVRVVQLAENLQREDLPILEEAHALRELKDELGLSLRALAERLNLSKSYVDRRIRVPDWPDELQNLLKERPGLFSRLDEIAAVKDEDEWRRQLAALKGEPVQQASPKRKVKPRGRPPNPFVFKTKEDGSFDLRVKYRPGQTDRDKLIAGLRGALAELEQVEDDD